MHQYRIFVQFAAAANAPGFDEIMPLIRKSVDHYNSRSRIAKNPKQIVDVELPDPKTLLLTLQSEAELEHPSKALKLFSQYLVTPSTEGHLGEFVSGKQIFKMYAEPLSGHMPAQSSPEGIDSLRIQAIALALTATADQLNEAIKILKEETR